MRTGKVIQEIIIEPMPVEEGPPEREIKRDPKPVKEREAVPVR